MQLHIKACSMSSGAAAAHVQAAHTLFGRQLHVCASCTDLRGWSAVMLQCEGDCCQVLIAWLVQAAARRQCNARSFQFIHVPTFKPYVTDVTLFHCMMPAPHIPDACK